MKIMIFQIMSLVLFALGFSMILIGTKKDILPPTLTGVGFTVIAGALFLLTVY